MVLLDKYLQVIEKTPESQTRFFKVLHLITITVTCVSALLTSYAFGAALKCFGFQCILYANIQFTNTPSVSRHRSNAMFPNDLPRIDLRNTKWGSTELCNYVHFSIIICGIFAFIWGAFFVISGRGGSGRRTDELVMPWRIVFPALVFTTLFAIFIIQSAVYLKNGTEMFCAQFEPVFNETKCTDRINVYSLIYNEKEKDFINYMRLVRIGTTICLWSWVVQLIVILVRFFTGHDFNILIISIYSENHKNELEAAKVPLNNGNNVEVAEESV